MNPGIGPNPASKPITPITATVAASLPISSHDGLAFFHIIIDIATNNIGTAATTMAVAPFMMLVACLPTTHIINPIPAKAIAVFNKACHETILSKRVITNANNKIANPSITRLITPLLAFLDETNLSPKLIITKVNANTKAPNKRTGNKRTTTIIAKANNRMPFAKSNIDPIPLAVSLAFLPDANQTYSSGPRIKIVQEYGAAISGNANGNRNTTNLTVVIIK